MLTDKSTSGVEYTDPEIRQWQRELRVLETARRTTVTTDRVVSTTPVHQPDGSVYFVVTTKDGHVWLNKGEDAPWVEIFPPVPNTPAGDDYEEIVALKRKIAYRIATQGKSPIDDDIVDLVGEDEDDTE